MKLVTALQQQVSNMGPLRFAWFTSFSTDIEFIETYALPAAIGSEKPRTRLEYEELQQELTQQNIDFRVFCDPRFLETNRVKRTSIPVHGIRPERLSQKFGEKSLFHPKIIYLEDINGKRVIGAGSANLTLSGWARNLEVFHFCEIKTYDNYREIRRFFAQLCAAANIPCELKARGKFPLLRENWRFVHSLQDVPFAKQLLDGTRNADLVAWSPYLPRDLAGFIGQLEATTGSTGLKVHLVPDLIEGKFLRTQWSEALGGMTVDGRLSFYDIPVQKSDKVELRHAKVWKLAGKLAIGSWNFTGPGANLLRNGAGGWGPENNMEAGFIIHDGNNWKKACGKQLDMGAGDCASIELLAREDLFVEKLPPFDLHISFDWLAHRYEFQGEWLKGEPRGDFSVKLPGVKAFVSLKWSKKGKPSSPGALSIDDGILTRDRIFQVYDPNGNIIHQAVIAELNTKSRRVYSFESLHDLLDAFVHGDDPGTVANLPFRVPFDADTFADDRQILAWAHDSKLEAEAIEQVGISYFRLFRSTHAYEVMLAQIDELERLEQQVFSRPGCLLELVGKTREALDDPSRPIFNWFLANEVGSLCAFAKRRRRQLLRGSRGVIPAYKAAPKGRWDEVAVAPTDLPAGASQEYSELIKKQSGYA